jgi:hypothetical protein
LLLGTLAHPTSANGIGTCTKPLVALVVIDP